MRRTAKVVAAFTVASTLGLGSAPARAVEPAASYRFLLTDGADRPARWSPCQPVRWAVNLDGAPEGSLDLITDAIATVSAASGLPFTYAGTATVKPLQDPEAAAPSGVDAVIAFGSAAEYLELTGAIVGLAGFTTVATDDGPRIVSGGVVLDGRRLATLTDGFGGGLSRGSAVLHELGHLVGLGHVDAPGQLMDWALDESTPGDFADGDSAGLARLGASAGCFATDAAP